MSEWRRWTDTGPSKEAQRLEKQGYLMREPPIWEDEEQTRIRVKFHRPTCRSVWKDCEVATRVEAAQLIIGYYCACVPESWRVMSG